MQIYALTGCTTWAYAKLSKNVKLDNVKLQNLTFTLFLKKEMVAGMTPITVSIGQRNFLDLLQLWTRLNKQELIIQTVTFMKGNIYYGILTSVMEQSRRVIYSRSWKNGWYDDCFLLCSWSQNGWGFLIHAWRLYSSAGLCWGNRARRSHCVSSWI